MKYIVEYRREDYNLNWFEDEDFDKLSAAIEYATGECLGNPSMQHRIVKVRDVEQVMFFPAIEEVTDE